MAQSRSCARTANTPRAEQTEERVFFRIETDIARLHDAQMPRTKVIDRSSVEILLDHGWAHVRVARDRRRVSEPLADHPHHVCDHLLRLGVGLGRAVLCERDRSRERAAPRAEVLR